MDVGEEVEPSNQTAPENIINDITADFEMRTRIDEPWNQS
jgi:hypothetical protein